MKIRDKVLECYETLRLEIADGITKDAFITEVEYGRNWVRIHIRAIFDDDAQLWYSVYDSEPL